MRISSTRVVVRGRTHTRASYSSFFRFRFEAHRVLLLVRPRRSSLVSRYARFLRFVAGYARFWSFYSAGSSWVAVRSPLSASVSSGSWNSERSKVEEKHFEDRIIFQVLNVSSCGQSGTNESTMSPFSTRIKSLHILGNFSKLMVVEFEDASTRHLFLWFNLTFIHVSFGSSRATFQGDPSH